MKIFPLTEGAFTIDRSKKFIPFEMGVDDLQKRTKGSLLVEVQPFVVITSKDIIILDTGLGFTDDTGQLQIHKNLAALGINPTDVTKVLLSHLHKDHTGGIAYPNKRIVAFENAEYFVNKNEWEYAFQNESLSYHKENFALLERYSKLIFVEEDGAIEDYIHYEVTGAHCPYHQIFKIIEDDEIVFFGGDVAPQLQQLKSRYRAKYDFDGIKSMGLRQEWRKKGEEENWTFLFYHDIKYPVYQFM